MKFFQILFFIGLYGPVFAQPQGGTIFEVVEEFPVFPTCTDRPPIELLRRTCTKKQLERFVSDSLRIAAADSVVGNTEVTFVVELDGSVQEVVLLHPLSPKVDTAIVHLFRSMKGWQPGRIKSQAVRTRLGMPLSFQPDNAQYERMGFQSFSDVLCMSYKSSYISGDELRVFLQALPDSLRSCDPRRVFEHLKIAVSRPESRTEVAESNTSQIVTAKMRRLLKESPIDTRVTLEITMRVSGQVLKVRHDLLVE